MKIPVAQHDTKSVRHTGEGKRMCKFYPSFRKFRGAWSCVFIYVTGHADRIDKYGK
jgi:hypothetical protein